MHDAVRLRQPLLWLLLLVALVCLAVAPAGADDMLPMRLQGYAGGVVSLSSEADATAAPIARIAVEAPLAQGYKPPFLLVNVDLSALPGEGLSVSDPETFRSVEAEFALAWRPWWSSPVQVWGSAGFATRLPDSPEPRDRTARWAAAGARLADATGNALSIGAGLDQRLDGVYQPAVLVSGSVQLWRADGGGVAALLVGRAILGLDFTGYSATHDVVQLGVVLAMGSR